MGGGRDMGYDRFSITTGYDRLDKDSSLFYISHITIEDFKVSYQYELDEFAKLFHD